MATKTVDFDLAEGPPDAIDFTGYSHVLVLFRWRGKVLGQMWWKPVANGRLPAYDLWWSASVILVNNALSSFWESLYFPKMQRKDGQARLLFAVSWFVREIGRTIGAAVSIQYLPQTPLKLKLSWWTMPQAITKRNSFPKTTSLDTFGSLTTD
jgi:hypothetical protein